ncbi:hypothetical protein HOE04_01690 [archaeon]|nr:hypothetical protein [archaeon]
MGLQDIFDTGRDAKLQAYSRVPIEIDNSWYLGDHVIINGDDRGFRIALYPKGELRTDERPLFLGREHNVSNPEFFLLTTFSTADPDDGYTHKEYNVYTGSAPILKRGSHVNSGFVEEEIPELKNLNTMGKVIPGYQTGVAKMFKISFFPFENDVRNYEKQSDIYILGSEEEPSRVLDGDPSRFTKILDNLFFELD